VGAVPPRVRFSPSPTGPFHVGGARTALFNWLYARHEGGAFLLRNEDTDPVRSSDAWLEGILDGLRWLGLEWDEEIVRQSERRDAHVEAAHELVAGGHAYWCDCTPEAIEARKGPGGGYDGFCRDRGLGPGEDRVVRFRVPAGTTTVTDVVRERAAFENDTIDDFVLLRRGGAPMFVLANAVDDEFQRVTHVIRGEEHLSTTPKYILIRRALGYGEDPVFAHLPLLVNEKRQKLSKRRDRVALLEFRDQGYLAVAMRNYLATLGWSPRGDEELVPVERMIEQFRLEDITRAPAFFDVRKLQHFNAHYLRELSPEEFAAAARPWVEAESVPWRAENVDPERFATVAPLAQTRITLLSELPEIVAFLFQVPVDVDEASWEKAIGRNEWSGDVLREALAAYADCAWEADTLKDVTAAIGDRHGLKLGKAQAPVRVAITGRTVGLPLFESLEALGREAARERIQVALDRLAVTAPAGSG
jgi:glutamyl-tRNA synthetase